MAKVLELLQGMGLKVADVKQDGEAQPELQNPYSHL